MPAIINLASALVLGGAVAWVLRRSAALRREFLGWPLLVLVAFLAIVWVPATTFLFRFYPEWSLLYAYDPQVFPRLGNWFGLLSLVVAMLNVAAAIGAFAMTRLGVKRERAWLVFAAPAIGVLVFLVVVVFCGKRLLFLGDYDAYWQGSAELFLWRGGGWLGVALYALAAGFVRVLARRAEAH